MRSVNRVILLGNLTRDPEVRQALNGQKIVTFGLATNREWNGSDGQKNSLAEYHNIVAFGTLADLCMKLLSKGALVYVEGYLKTRSWDHESGVKFFRTETVANDMICLNRKAKASPEEGVHEEDTADLQPDLPSEPAGTTFDDDDFFSEAPASEGAEK